MANILLLVEPSHILQQIQDTMKTMWHKESQTSPRLIIATSQFLHQASTAKIQWPKAQILAIVKRSELEPKNDIQADDYFAASDFELDPLLLKAQIKKMLAKASIIGTIRSLLTPSPEPSPQHEEFAWDHFYELLQAENDEQQALAHWASLTPINSTIQDADLKELFKRVRLKLITKTVFQFALPALKQRANNPSSFFWFCIHQHCWGKAIPQLDGLRNRIFAKTKLGRCEASNETHALYIAQSTEALHSVLVSLPDTLPIASCFWECPVPTNGLDIRLGPPCTFMLAAQKREILPPQQAWQRIRPLFETLLTPEAIQGYNPKFSMLRIYEVPDVGYLVNSDPNMDEDCYYTRTVSDPTHIEMVKSLFKTSRSYNPFDYMLYQLTAAFIYSINKTYIDHQFHGPWRPWIENISKTLLCADLTTTMTQSQVFEFYQTELNQGGITKLTNAFQDDIDPNQDHQGLKYLQWWLPAAACLHQKHREGKAYGYLEPDAFWFVANGSDIQMPEVRNQDFTAPEIEQTGPTIASDVYSITLILVAMLTKPQDRHHLYRKDWSLVPPSLSKFLMHYLQPDPSQRPSSVATLAQEIKQRLNRYDFERIADQCNAAQRDLKHVA